MKKQLNKQIVEIPSHLKRINYFNGRLLNATDLSTEQTYIDTRMKDHNRYIHGYGTVSGLAVSTSKNSPDILTVNPGVAIDRWGHEIILTTDVKVPFPKKMDVTHLVLCWAERETDFAPAPSGNGDGEDKVASHIEEYAILKYEVEHSSAKPCGIALARLKKVRSVWKVDKRFRVCRVKSNQG
jgi:hypothetical protein